MTNEMKSAEEILRNAIRHIRRVHMNTRTWTLPLADSQAIDLMLDIRESELSNQIVEFEGYFRSQEFVSNALGLRKALGKLSE